MKDDHWVPTIRPWDRRCVTLAMGWAIVLMAGSAQGQDPFAADVRPTEPLTPEEQQERLEVPPGFEIELFASEPEIGKPMNMAFDSQGRLWLTQSREYPFPAPLDEPGRDQIKILEDTTGDGRADEITTFADGLNIPIGVYPYRDGAIAWSIPNIWHFRDHDGDGRADERQKLYGPLGWERDAHGMNASFTRGFDGWLYITHGFNNRSTIRGSDGHTIRLESGNTYRVRLDGSRVEPHTWGQVNPFGLCFDPRGHLYSADCHSRPVYQLIPRGYYPSFGRPHDGLGFAPELMDHMHGSTAIAGVVYYADTLWPQAFRQNLFVGNVMTSRVNRDRLTFTGSTPVAEEQPDLVRSRDPWFRPVDLQLGPDGALYIADFYNRIIGHYEVPLDHPGRDRKRGRIWRLVYRGEGDQEAGHSPLDLQEAALSEVVAALAHPNLTRRRLAMNELVDRRGRAAVPEVREALEDQEDPPGVAHSLWVLHRLGALPERRLQAAAQEAEALVRVHAMRILGEHRQWSESLRQIALDGLRDPSPQVKRAAAAALARHPSGSHLRPLLDARHAASEGDSHLVHQLRIALRNQLRDGDAYGRLPLETWEPRDARAIADVSLGVESQEAASYLIGYLEEEGPNEPKARMADYLRHTARFLPESRAGDLARIVQSCCRDRLDLQTELFEAIDQGLGEAGIERGRPLKDWGQALAKRLLSSVRGAAGDWRSFPLNAGEAEETPWIWQERPGPREGEGVELLSSLPPNGETLTGILRSEPFEIPDNLEFLMAGHDGPPGEPPQKQNRVRLRLAATGEIVAESFPPRQDAAEIYRWDLADHAGKEGVLEAVDANTDRAYAWLAFGHWNPAVVRMPTLDPREIEKRQKAGAKVAGRVSATSLIPQLRQLLESEEAAPAVRVAAARALLEIESRRALPWIGELLQQPDQPAPLREQWAKVIGRSPSAASRQALLGALEEAPWALQQRLARELARNRPGAEALLGAIQSGKAPRQLLFQQPLQEQLKASRVPNLQQRLNTLTQGAGESAARQAKRIQARVEAYDPTAASIERGAEVFRRHCMACHQFQGTGGLIGPQLDGISNRGVRRLVEDILAPNRNVDQAFRYRTIRLQNGDVRTGLFRRNEGEERVYVDMTGEELRIPAKEIVEEEETESSLMPNQFGEMIPEARFNDLLAYLLQAGQEP